MINGYLKKGVPITRHTDNRTKRTTDSTLAASEPNWAKTDTSVTEELLPDDFVASEAGLDDIEQAPSVARSTAVMSIATLFSRLTGFIRVWATAFALGAGLTASAFTLANNIPNMIYELMAGGILSAVFIPVFLEVRAKRGKEEGSRFASHAMNLAMLMLMAVALIGMIFPQPFIWTQTFRLAKDTVALRSLSNFFFRFFAFQVVLYAFGAIVQGVLNAQRKFLWPAVGSIFNNVVVVIVMFWVGFTVKSSHGALVLATSTKVVLGLGTTLGVLAMFAVMVPSLLKSGFHYHFELGWRDHDVRRMIVLAIPAVIYTLTNLVASSFQTTAASSISGSGAAIVYFANTWVNLPYGILSVALTTALYTEMSTYATRKDIFNFKRSMTSGLRSTALLMLPTSAVLFALSTQVISLFAAGKFLPSDVPTVAMVLQYWSVSLVFRAVMIFIIFSFYALKDTKTVALANLAATVFQAGGYLILTTGIFGWKGFGYIGIPISDGIFYVLLFSSLLFLMRRKVGAFDIKSFIVVFLKTMLASAVGGGAAYFLQHLMAGSLGSGKVAAIIIIAGAGIVGLIISFALIWLLRVQELSVLSSIGRRFGGKFGLGKRGSDGGGSGSDGSSGGSPA
ncbi:MAG: murein biosynthesis integral membrane protein MurJ [Coriobacteriia bacterium]|nr:murein biosynthesis integral membrane protein MurJ [Coriobacteriia bacterium]